MADDLIYIGEWSLKEERLFSSAMKNHTMLLIKKKIYIRPRTCVPNGDVSFSRGEPNKTSAFSFEKKEQKLFLLKNEVDLLDLDSRYFYCIDDDN